MWSRRDNQEGGLEAAILERVRNSSLVKWFRADNVAGLKHTAEAVALQHVPAAPCGGRPGAGVGRGEACGGGGGGGEGRVAGEAAEGSSRGRHASENAGMSSERGVRISSAG